MIYKIIFCTVLAVIVQTLTLSTMNSHQHLVQNHLIELQRKQAHDFARQSKLYNFKYEGKVEPETYLGKNVTSPRIANYLPILGPKSQILPFESDLEKVKEKFINKVGAGNTIDLKRAQQLVQTLNTDNGNLIVKYFEGLAKGGLNFYKLSPKNYRLWLAIKIIANQDIKAYARTVAEDKDLFQEFYKNARDFQINEVNGVTSESPMQNSAPITTPQVNNKTSTQNSKLVNKYQVKTVKSQPEDRTNKTKPQQGSASPTTKVNTITNTTKINQKIDETAKKGVQITANSTPTQIVAPSSQTTNAPQQTNATSANISSKPVNADVKTQNQVQTPQQSPNSSTKEVPQTNPNTSPVSPQPQPQIPVQPQPQPAPQVQPQQSPISPAPATPANPITPVSPLPQSQAIPQNIPTPKPEAIPATPVPSSPTPPPVNTVITPRI